jgi:Domain of Unknown Function (DUF928)
MTKKSYVYSLIPFILSLVFVLFSNAKFPGQAQTPLPPANSPSAVPAINFNPPDREMPLTVGGAVGCGEKILCNRLVVFIPIDRNNPNGYTRLGLTVSEHPKIFFYTPGLPDNAGQEFDFYLDQYNAQTTRPIAIYTETVQLPTTPGIIQVSLPSDISLEVGQYYQWFVQLSCDEPQIVEFQSSQGWLERIEVPPQLAQKLASASTPIERAAIYAEMGIWIDALDTLVQARRQADTPELQAAWRALLEDEDAGFSETWPGESFSTPEPILD